MLTRPCPAQRCVSSADGHRGWNSMPVCPHCVCVCACICVWCVHVYVYVCMCVGLSMCVRVYFISMGKKFRSLFLWVFRASFQAGASGQRSACVLSTLCPNYYGFLVTVQECGRGLGLRVPRAGFCCCRCKGSPGSLAPSCPAGPTAARDSCDLRPTVNVCFGEMFG